MKSFDTKGRRDFPGMDDGFNIAAIMWKRKSIGVCGDDSAKSIKLRVSSLIACVFNALSS